MAYVWLTSTRHQEAAVSQWVEDPKEPSGWRWAHDAPAGDPSVTQIFNAILYPSDHKPTEPAPSGFETDDGSWYARASADEFPEAT